TGGQQLLLHAFPHFRPEPNNRESWQFYSLSCGHYPISVVHSQDFPGMLRNCHTLCGCRQVLETMALDFTVLVTREFADRDEPRRNEQRGQHAFAMRPERLLLDR